MEHIVELLPRRALLNDVNPHLISFYRWLQRGLDLRTAGVSLKNDRAIYAHNRARFNELIRKSEGETAEAAALFYYLNRTGYNGLCRFNGRGFFNVPFGRYKHIECTKDFSAYRATLSRYEIVQGDFDAIDFQPTDFIYADPPYDVEFTSYSAGGFTWNDQRRLAKLLAAHPGPVVASNQATKRVLRLYRELGFAVKILDAPRRISCSWKAMPPGRSEAWMERRSSAGSRSAASTGGRRSAGGCPRPCRAFPRRATRGSIGNLMERLR